MLFYVSVNGWHTSCWLAIMFGANCPGQKSGLLLLCKGIYSSAQLCRYKTEEYEMRMVNRQTSIDKRIDQRRPYSGNIFFVSKNGFNEGRLKDYSRSGLFINTKAPLALGEIITVALPYVDDKRIKCQGQIIWSSKEGFGIELFRKRGRPHLQVIK